MIGLLGVIVCVGTDQPSPDRIEPVRLTSPFPVAPIHVAHDFSSHQVVSARSVRDVPRGLDDD